MKVQKSILPKASQLKLLVNAAVTPGKTVAEDQKYNNCDDKIMTLIPLVALKMGTRSSSE